MAKAIWNGGIIAESDAFEIVEGSVLEGHHGRTITTGTA